MSPREGPKRPTIEKPALTSALIVVIMAQVQKAKLVWAARVLGMNNRLFTRQPRAPDTALACPTNGGMLRFSALRYVGWSPGGDLADAFDDRVPVVDFAVLR